MSDKNKKGFDWSFSNKSVDDRLDKGREEMAEKKDEKPKKKKEGEPSGHLDTQLFPNRKKPYHE
jgi:hypothetical protein